MPDFPYEDGDVPCDSKFFHDMDIYDCKQSGKCDYDSELTQGDVGMFVIRNYMKRHRKIFFRAISMVKRTGGSLNLPNLLQ